MAIRIDTGAPVTDGAERRARTAERKERREARPLVMMEVLIAELKRRIEWREDQLARAERLAANARGWNKKRQRHPEFIRSKLARLEERLKAAEARLEKEKSKLAESDE
jgi:hypothetical protein